MAKASAAQLPLLVWGKHYRLPLLPWGQRNPGCCMGIPSTRALRLPAEHLCLALPLPATLPWRFEL